MCVNLNQMLHCYVIQPKTNVYRLMWGPFTVQAPLVVQFVQAQQKILKRTSMVDNNTYKMFDIFYNNTNGDSFEKSSLATAGFEIRGDLIYTCSLSS